MMTVIEAKASPQEQHTIDLKTIFAAEDPSSTEMAELREMFRTQGRETYAALSVNGSLEGVFRNGAGHAEQMLLRSREWHSALDYARNRADNEERTGIAVAINRSPCHALCTPELRSAIVGITASPRARFIRFLLTPTGIYEPTVEITDQDIENFLNATAARLNISRDEAAERYLVKLRRGLSREENRHFTTANDLLRLAGAGWDIRQLQARERPTAAGQILAEFAARIDTEVRRDLVRDIEQARASR
jgi:hypothetical protein